MKRTARSSEPKRRRPTVVSAPQRTCVACGTTRAKRLLVRVVRSPAGVLSVDARGKAPGRGAYLDPVEACLARGLTEHALEKALLVTIDVATRDRLRAEIANVAGQRPTSGRTKITNA